MKKLTGFQDFLFSINEGIIRFSPPIEQELDRIQNSLDVESSVRDLAYRLHRISRLQKDLRSDFNLIDISDNRGYFSYQNSNKLRDPSDQAAIRDRDLVTDQWILNSQSGIGIWSGKRPEVRMGSLFTKVLKDDGVENIDQKSLESLVQILNTKLYQSLDPSLEFKLVSGDDIKKYYHESKMAEAKGTLGGSCMRHDRCSSYLDIYTENPDVCRLLILVTEYDYILGRALIWNATTDDGQEVEVMDRIYYISDEVKYSFLQYALSKGWWSKKFQDSKEDHMKMFIVPGVGEVSKGLKIQLKDQSSNDKYPFVDTFMRFRTPSNIITNIHPDDNRNEGYVYLIMRNTDGGFSRGRHGEWGWDSKIIPPNFAKKSNYLQQFVDTRYSHLVDLTDRRTGEKFGLMPEDHPEFTWCYRVVNGMDEYVPGIRDRSCKYSVTMGEWIEINSFVYVVEQMDEYLEVETIGVSIKSQIGKSILDIDSLLHTSGGKIWVKLYRIRNSVDYIHRDLVDSEGYLVADTCMTGKSPIDGLFYTVDDSRILKRGVRNYSKKTCKFAYLYQMAPIMKKLATERGVKDQKWLDELDDWMKMEGVVRESMAPQINPLNRSRASRWISNYFNTHLQFILDTIGYKIPKNLDSDQLKEELKEVEERAVEFFTKFPEKLPNDDQIDFKRVNVGSAVPITNRVGGVHKDKTFF